MKAVITFFNNDKLILKEGDQIVPITYVKDIGKPFSAKEMPIDLKIHISDGLIPSILDALSDCKFFYINFDNDCVYNCSAIVKIEQQ